MYINTNINNTLPQKGNIIPIYSYLENQVHRHNPSARVKLLSPIDDFLIKEYNGFKYKQQIWSTIIVESYSHSLKVGEKRRFIIWSKE